MTGRPRGEVIDESEVGLYHVFSRCVRRAFLCGADPVTKKDYNHRRQWIVDRVQFLVASFAIEACTFAVLSNHYHLLIRNRPDEAEQWSDYEVAVRWWRLTWEGRDRAPTEADIRSLLAIEGWVAERRRRLASPSWFMKYLNERIAHWANREDEVDGHFWQERFRARRIDSDIDALFTSLYIDLNEIRACLADRPENARYTSASRRLCRLVAAERALQLGRPDLAEVYAPDDPDFWLCPIDESSTAPLLSLPTIPERSDNPETEQDVKSRNKQQPSATASILRAVRKRHGFLPVNLSGYFEALETLGRSLAPGKAGRIDPDLPPLLERIGINSVGYQPIREKIENLFQYLMRSVVNFERDAGRRPGWNPDLAGPDESG